MNFRVGQRARAAVVRRVRRRGTCCGAATCAPLPRGLRPASNTATNASAICTPVKHKKVVKGLGFTRLNQVIVRPDTPAIRGMVKKIPHLIEVVG